MEKATVTLKNRKYTVELDLVDADTQTYEVREYDRLVGTIRPYAALEGYWAFQLQGRARRSVAATKGRAAAIKDLLTAK